MTQNRRLKIAVAVAVAGGGLIAQRSLCQGIGRGGGALGQPAGRHAILKRARGARLRRDRA